MSIVLGIDLGTTTITALAVDAASGQILARSTAANQAETTSASDKMCGRSEWDVRQIAVATCAGIRAAAQQLGERRRELAGIGLTGQQHGVVIVDGDLAPLTPFINWQDRRGDEQAPRSEKTYVRQARELFGEDAPSRAGCRLATGYLAVTLFWLKLNNLLPSAGRAACFLVDYFAALLTGQVPATDATSGASSGVLDVASSDWDSNAIAALGLPRSLFPAVRPAGGLLGVLTGTMAEATGLAAGLPVFVGMGDNQASFLGSVARWGDAALVNVGTGGQVAAFASRYNYDPLLETRPFPRGGYLLVSAGLCGGGSYAVLERFFREVGAQLLGVPAGAPLYAAMNQLAATVPPGADGLRCEPFFLGTRSRPELRATWSGMSGTNFTPAHMTRALLEGMAHAFRGGYELIVQHSSSARNRLIGSGNGLRENPLLTRIVAETFGMPLVFPLHREEAAFGAALLAMVGAGLFPDLAAPGKFIRY